MMNLKKIESIAILSILISSLFFIAVFAQGTELNPKEYGFFATGFDRVRLAFTFNAQHRAEIIDKIAERRAEHYQFLLDQGKTDVAERYLQKTESFVSKRLADLNASTTNKQEILDRIYADVPKNRTKVTIGDGVIYGSSHTSDVLCESCDVNVKTERVSGGY